MTKKLFRFKQDGARCCGCNYSVTNHYVRAESQEAAEAELEKFDGRSLCGDCMCQLICHAGHTIVEAE